MKQSVRWEYIPRESGRYRKLQLDEFTLLGREGEGGRVKRANRFVYLYNMLYLYLCHVRVEVYTTPLSLSLSPFYQQVAVT